MSQKIDINKLKEVIEQKHDPFDFYLFLVINNNCCITNDNPFANDIAFLETLLQHYEAEEKFHLCVELRKRLKNCRN